MNPSGKKPGVAFWATVVATMFALLLAYPLSFGPACWLCGTDDHFDDGAFCTFYRPLVVVVEHSPQSVRNAARWYFERWLPPHVEFIGDPDGAWWHEHPVLGR